MLLHGTYRIPGPDCAVSCRIVDLSSGFLSFFLSRTGKMGNHRPSSSEKRKRKLGSTGDSGFGTMSQRMKT